MAVRIRKWQKKKIGSVSSPIAMAFGNFPASRLSQESKKTSRLREQKKVAHTHSCHRNSLSRGISCALAVFSVSFVRILQSTMVFFSLQIGNFLLVFSVVLYQSPYTHLSSWENSCNHTHTHIHTHTGTMCFSTFSSHWLHAGVYALDGNTISNVFV